MLAIIAGPGSRLAYAQFGAPLGPPEARKPFLRWVLEDYPRRRDEQWRCAPPQGMPVVREILGEAESPQIAAAALLALGWYGLPECAPDLLRYLDDPRLVVQSAAVRGLGQIGWVRTIPVVEGKLTHPGRQVRREALIALGKFGRVEVLPRLSAAAAPELDGAEIVEHATRRTRAVASGDVPGMVEAVIRSPEYEDLCVWMPFIWSQLAEMPPDPRRELPIRVRAAHLLGLGQARKSGRMLLALLTEAKTPRPLRIECAIALARLGLPKAAEGLIPLLDVEDSELQLAVIAALGRTGSPRALAPLLDRWDAHEKTLREPLRLALRALGRVSAIDALLSRWPRSEDPAQPPAAAVIEGDRWTSTEGPAWVRAQLARPQAAARADAAAVLGMIGDPSDVPRLARMVAGDDDEEVRWIAAAAARRLSGETDLTP